MDASVRLEALVVRRVAELVRRGEEASVRPLCHEGERFTQHEGIDVGDDLPHGQQSTAEPPTSSATLEDARTMSMPQEMHL